MRVVAGIDIGGTNAKFGLVDEKGECGYIKNIATKEFQSPIHFAQNIAGRIFELLLPHQELIGIGIGVANGNFYNGTIEYSPNLPWHGIVPLAQLFEREMQVPCILTNDANAAAIGEMLFGGAKKMKDFIFVTLGTGLGSGIVSNGQVIYGHDGLAAELGHVMINKKGRSCGCGRKGCLETYVSATGIKRTVYNWISRGEKTILANYKTTIDATDISYAARNGDALALKAFEFTGEILGHALANSVAYTSPKAIFLFGGLANAKELLFEPTIRHFEKNLLTIYKNKIQIRPSELEENKVAILGAASLVWKQNSDRGFNS
jgi:glucokinase